MLSIKKYISNCVFLQSKNVYNFHYYKPIRDGLKLFRTIIVLHIFVCESGVFYADRD